MSTWSRRLLAPGQIFVSLLKFSGAKASQSVQSRVFSELILVIFLERKYKTLHSFKWTLYQQSSNAQWPAYDKRLFYWKLHNKVMFIHECSFQKCPLTGNRTALYSYLFAFEKNKWQEVWIKCIICGLRQTNKHTSVSKDYLIHWIDS